MRPGYGEDCFPESEPTVLERAARQVVDNSLDKGSSARRTSLAAEECDCRIAAYLAEAEANTPAAWTGSEAVHREFAPAYFQYPAMMSPAVQRDLLRLLVGLLPGPVSVVDPFCGSGTVLTEAMYQGLECWVSDLNPLAVLICQVKAGPYEPSRLKGLLTRVVSRAKADSSSAITTSLPNWRKWFRQRTAVQLSRLRRSIRKVRDADSRKFFWVCLAETVRLTSNSRTSTYKLHIRPQKEIDALPAPIQVFADVAAENIANHNAVAEKLREFGLLQDGRCTSKTNVARREATEGFSKPFDVLMTSPPYGDNVSTVPYGQNSYLPLNWIDLADIDLSAGGADLLRTTHEIDRKSLGGCRPSWEDVAGLKPLRERSPSLDAFLRSIARKPRDRTARVIGFFRDLDAVLPNLVAAVRVDGYLVWTVGNRHVGGHEVPMAEILTELLSDRSAVLVGRCRRRIPRKRMAFRNSISSTMREEHLIVFRRVAARPVPDHG